MGGRCDNVSSNAPYVLSRDQYLVLITLETPLLRDGTKVPDATSLADI